MAQEQVDLYANTPFDDFTEKVFNLISETVPNFTFQASTALGKTASGDCLYGQIFMAMAIAKQQGVRMPPWPRSAPRPKCDGREAPLPKHIAKALRNVSY